MENQTSELPLTNEEAEETYDFNVIWDRIALLQTSLATRPILKEDICGHDIAFLFDKGSPANIFDLDTYKAIFSDLPIVKSK